MRRNDNRKGFTLIELLIVIAIIGILAAVLIPNLLAARTRAFDAAAQSCANAISTAQGLYSIDNRGAYAPSRSDFDTDMVAVYATVCADIDVDDTGDWIASDWTVTHNAAGTTTFNVGVNGISR